MNPSFQIITNLYAIFDFEIKRNPTYPAYCIAHISNEMFIRFGNTSEVQESNNISTPRPI